MRHATWARELTTRDGKEWNESLISQIFWQREADAIKSIPISQIGNKDRLI